MNNQFWSIYFSVLEAKFLGNDDFQEVSICLINVQIWMFDFTRFHRETDVIQSYWRMRYILSTLKVI